MQDPKTDQAVWYSSPPEVVAQQLQVDPDKGLSASDVEERLNQYGPNQLTAKKKEAGWQAFLRQYRDLMQVILIVAAVVGQIITGQWSTTFMLVTLTFVNAVLGLRQEAKAEASLAQLEKMMRNVARVRRDGRTVEIDAEQLVPGDIVLIKAGNRVPADGRLFVAATLEIEEAALTGESTPTLKSKDAIDRTEVPLGDRLCMVYMNTTVTRGRGELIVTATGMSTEIGHIAELLNKTETDRTPLQKQLDRLTIAFASLAGVAFILMLIFGRLNGQPFPVLFVSGVALAIAAIPTGMPVAVTTLYSFGTRVLASQNAIVKRLPSVETLGSVSAICTDKTGTLTFNKMTAREFTVPGRNRYKVTGEGYSTEGELLHAGGTKLDLDAILLPMALCADARIYGEELIGDPTEGALIVLAEKGGIHVDGARQMYRRIAEVPFDSDHKFMATFHNMLDESGKPVVRCFVKGAPDVLIPRSGYFWVPEGQALPITNDNRFLATEENERMAQSGERVIVIACRDFDPATFASEESLIDLVTDLTLLAMVGIVDPPRPEAKAAIATCQNAGIDVRMITGDHAMTAAAIGCELGIEGESLTGQEFAGMSDAALMEQIDHIAVIARVAPEDKIRLVTILQDQANIVAMTGDGVNDAPALKKADIGVAMGITGTEAAKEAAVMILTDDNFATIVKAVEYGRAIYNKLSNYIRRQVTALIAFIATFLGAGLFSISHGIPFAPLVILWINFAVQLPIILALGLDTPPADLMQHKPRPISQPILSRSQWIHITVIGLLMAGGTLLIEWHYESIDTVLAATMAFVVFSLLNISIGLSGRSEFNSILNQDFLGDSRQVQLYGIALLVILLPTVLGFLQRGFGLKELTFSQWFVCIVYAAALLLIEEIIKFFMRRQRYAAQSQAELFLPNEPGKFIL